MAENYPTDETISDNASDQSKRLHSISNTKTRLNLNIDIGSYRHPMVASDKYLLYCGQDSLRLVDRMGNETFRVKTDFNVDDMCWSNYLNQFLILSDKRLYSLNVIQELNLVKEFGQRMVTCTCFQERFLASTGDETSVIEEYDISTRTLSQTLTPSMSHQGSRGITRIRFSSDGNHLAIIVYVSYHFFSGSFFELRRANDMTVVHSVHLGDDLYHLLALPNQQFWVSTYAEKKFFLIYSNGELEEKIAYDAKYIESTALIGEQCLVIQTDSPKELRFYDL